jgi:hypothetical protein
MLAVGFDPLAGEQRIAARVEPVEPVQQRTQQADDAELQLGAQIGGPSLAMAVAGNLLLVGVGPQVYEFWVTEDGPRLQRISPVLPGIVRDIAVEGDTVYVAAGQLITLGSDEFGNFTIDDERFIPSDDRRVSALALHGDWIYAATMESELSDRGVFFALSNKPGERFEIAGSQDAGGILRRIEIAGDEAYLMHAFGGVSVMDLSEPQSPLRLDTDMQYQDVSTLEGRRVAVWNDKLLFWDAGRPADSEPSAELVIPGLLGQQVHLHPDGALVAGEHGDVFNVPIDASDGFGEPAGLASGEASTSLLHTDLASSDEFFYASLADLPALEGFYPSELIRMGAKALAYSRAETRRFDVIDGPSLWPTGWVPDSNQTRLSSAEGGRDPHFRPRVWTHVFGELSEALKFEGLDEQGAYAPAMAVAPGLLFLAKRPGSVQLYDVTSPDWPIVPKLLSSVDAPLDEGFVVMQSRAETLYIAQDGIRRVDISNPAEPRLIEPSHDAGGVRDFELVGDRAYVSSREGFGMIDLSQPPSPIGPSARWLSDLSGSIGVAVSGDIAFVTGANPQNGITAVSLSDPGGLNIVGQLPGPTGDVSLFDNEVFVAVAGIGRIWIIDVSMPERMEIVGEFALPRYAAEGWGSGQVFPTLEDLEGDSRIEVFPRVHVYGDLIYYAGPMAGILGYQIQTDWASRPPNTPQPPAESGVFLPILTSRYEAGLAGDRRPLER